MWGGTGPNPTECAIEEEELEGSKWMILSLHEASEGNNATSARRAPFWVSSVAYEIVERGTGTRQWAPTRVVHPAPKRHGRESLGGDIAEEGAVEVRGKVSESWEGCLQEPEILGLSASLQGRLDRCEKYTVRYQELSVDPQEAPVSGTSNGN
ncbi:hypothetical protein B0H10DRAFT_1962157 [Mycena sp. CBHHK59/15]|nr:hypothetical protein B0H10DRAFT_1962157 [Mycena sp. CBHHK59/15]